MPWHLEVHYIEPHDPYFPLKKYYDRYDSKSISVPASFRDYFKGKPGLHRRKPGSGAMSAKTMFARAGPVTSRRWSSWTRKSAVF